MVLDVSGRGLCNGLGGVDGSYIADGGTVRTLRDWAANASGLFAHSEPPMLPSLSTCAPAAAVLTLEKALWLRCVSVSRGLDDEPDASAFSSAMVNLLGRPRGSCFPSFQTSLSHSAPAYS